MRSLRPKDRHVSPIESCQSVFNKEQGKDPETIDEKHGINEQTVQNTEERAILIDAARLAFGVDVNDG